VLDALVAEARIRWGLDPAAGLQVIAPERIAGIPIEPSRPLLLVPAALLGGAPGQEDSPLPGRYARADQSASAILQRLYPADHAVGRIGLADSTTVGELTDEIVSGPLYLAPVSAELAPAGPWALPWIADRLRRPDGCPWDREQTHLSLRKHLLEEAYEVYDAIDGGATLDLAEELGDLLLQIVLHAQLAAEAGVFDMTDVEEAIGRKIVRRHPHVFGDAKVSTASDVNRQWEQIKRAEREEAEVESGSAGVKSALDGISKSMPALAASQEMQERAANLGYDWPDIVGVVDKIHEELAELDAAATDEERREEVGDLLLVTVNLARRNGVDAEAALRAASDKFRGRFGRVERMARERNVQLRDLALTELDALWDAAKAEERAARSERPKTGQETAQ
jgi:tetrapyrrole methylase family protein/MazG family protein